MGHLISKIFANFFFSNQEVRVLILGLDNAGKTTILYKLYSPNRVIRTMPTLGFNVETVKYESLNFNVWDLGGQTNIRPFWRCYYENTSAIIYVVDSCDHNRLGLSSNELLAMLEEEELKNIPLLVFANKQDAKNALNEAEISTKLGLHTIKDRRWKIQKSSAINGDGLKEGLSWLAQTIQGKEIKNATAEEITLSTASVTLSTASPTTTTTTTAA